MNVDEICCTETLSECRHKVFNGVLVRRVPGLTHAWLPSHSSANASQTPWLVGVREALLGALQLRGGGDNIVTCESRDLACVTEPQQQAPCYLVREKTQFLTN